MLLASFPFLSSAQLNLLSLRLFFSFASLGFPSLLILHHFPRIPQELKLEAIRGTLEPTRITRYGTFVTQNCPKLQLDGDSFGVRSMFDSALHVNDETHEHELEDKYEQLQDTMKLFTMQELNDSINQLITFRAANRSGKQRVPSLRRRTSNWGLRRQPPFVTEETPAWRQEQQRTFGKALRS